MTDPTVTGAVVAALTDRARPLLTYYGPGQRVGLSGATLENWAAKTAGYLRDEVGLLPGDDVVVDLPEHWQTAAVLLGAWWAGLRVVPSGDDSPASRGAGAADARVVFTTLDRLDDYPDAEEPVVVPLDPFGGRVPGLPAFATDFGDAVRPHADQFFPTAAGPALGDADAAQVLAAARTAADADGLTPGMRVLSSRPWRSADQIVAHLLAPLVAGAALVWVDPAAGQPLPDIAATEHTDRTLS